MQQFKWLINLTLSILGPVNTGRNLFPKNYCVSVFVLNGGYHWCVSVTNSANLVKKMLLPLYLSCTELSMMSLFEINFMTLTINCLRKKFLFVRFVNTAIQTLPVYIYIFTALFLKLRGLYRVWLHFSYTSLLLCWCRFEFGCIEF